MLYVTARINSGNSARPRSPDTATITHAATAISRAQLIQRFLRLSIIFPGDGKPMVRLRRAVVLGGERLGVLGREGSIDRPLELFVLVDMDHVIGRRLRPAVLVDHHLLLVADRLIER